METVDPIRFIGAFVFVIGLIAGFAWLLRRYGNSQKFFAVNSEQARLQVVETRFIDPRRKLVLIKRDNTEHLLLLADGRELVIESNIAKKEGQGA